jgi:hypothetical protein
MFSRVVDLELTIRSRFASEKGIDGGPLKQIRSQNCCKIHRNPTGERNRDLARGKKGRESAKLGPDDSARVRVACVCVTSLDGAVVLHERIRVLDRAVYECRATTSTKGQESEESGQHITLSDV